MEALSALVPQLVVGITICGLVLLLLSDQRRMIPVLLVQRVAILALQWPALPTSWALISLVALLAVAAIYALTEWRLQRVHGSQAMRAGRGRLAHLSPSLRALTAALGLGVTYGLVQGFPWTPLPRLATFTVLWLIVYSALNLVLADSVLRTGWSALTFSDACRILYLLTQPTLLAWGLWATCDVLVALASAHLRTHEASALATGQSQ
jgi:divalent metal cation (Fe/Co/Zn/Cd) transporter